MTDEALGAETAVNKRRVFVLIHGTFATGASWAQEDSPLCRAIHNYDHQALIERYEWSRDNLQHVREAEVARLIK